VKDLVTQGVDLGLLESLIPRDVLVSGGIPSDEGAFADDEAVLCESFVAAEFINS
jgi:hypothetical protein